MSCPFIYKQAIKNATQWTDVVLQDEAGISKGSVHNANPGFRVGKSVIAALREIYFREVKCPYQDKIQIALKTLETYKEELSKTQFRLFLHTIMAMTKPDTTKILTDYEASGSWFIFARTGFELRFYTKDSAAPSSKYIINRYKKSRDHAWKALESNIYVSDKKAALLSAANKCNIMVFVTSFMTQSSLTRSTSEKNIQMLKEIKFLSSCKKIIEAEPWNWMAARNGLVGASIINDNTECDYFFKALKKSYHEFDCLDFKPVGMPSIINDPDLEWFRNNT